MSAIALFKVAAANGARTVLSGVFKLLVAGSLSPQAFGVLRSVHSLWRLASSLATFGLDDALVTMTAREAARGDTARRHLVLRTIFAIKLIVGVGVAVLGMTLLAEPVAIRVLGDAALAPLVGLVFLAVLGQLMLKFLAGWFSAHQMFGRLGVFLPTTPALMLVAGLCAFAVGGLRVDVALAIYLFTPLLVVGLFWPTLEAGWLRAPFFSRQLIGQIAAFSSWVYVSNIGSASRNHLNPILLKNPELSGSVAAGEEAAGQYAFGSDLAGELGLLSQSLLTVLLPKASEMRTYGELREFFSRSYRKLAIWLPLLVPLVFLAEPLLHALGAIWPPFLEYVPALDIFRILYLSNLVSLAAIPTWTAVYAMKRPHLEALIEVGGTVVFVIGSLLVIPHYGAVGAAVVLFVQRTVAFLVLAWIAWRVLQTGGDAELP